MKKKIVKKVLSIVLSCATLFSIVGCQDVSGFELGHYDGANTTNGYDSDLLYKNTSEFLGGDSGVIWVSEEDDPEYGGYFYQYMSEAGGSANHGTPSTEDGKTPSNSDDVAYHSHVVITRSKDLVDWECVGQLDNGMGLKLEMDSPIKCGNVWAPEVARDPKTGKYFMYFGGLVTAEYSATMLDQRLNANGKPATKYVACIAVSDSPMGPFEVVTAENMYNGGENPNGEILTTSLPTLHFERYFGETPLTGYCTDLNPFFDTNGDFYLFFNAAGVGISCYGMKMKDMATPDYSTITCLMVGGQENGIEIDDGDDGVLYAPVRAVYKGDVSKNAEIYPGAGINTEFPNDPTYPRWDYRSYIHYESWADGTPNTEYIEKDGKKVLNPDFNAHKGIGGHAIREGLQIICNKDEKGDNVYYLTMTFTGVQSPHYDVHWATATSPLGNEPGGEYTLPKGREFGTVIGVDASNDYMSNLGHHEFVEIDNEWWIVHWEWAEPFGNQDIGRLYALTPMTWLIDSRTETCRGDGYTTGFPVPIANGPTTNLQAKPSVSTGYRNIAGEGRVSASNVIDDSVKYLTDGYAVAKSMYADWEFRANKKTEIVIKFDEPRTVRGILIYNSYTYDNAFANISTIQFDLVETPTWYNGTEKSCFIRDLGFNPNSYDSTRSWIQAANASIATFNEIKVNQIVIEIDEHLGNSKELRISEIVILGK